jgi:phosphoribosylaminoimidazole-succinocarboxamide synthase
MTQEDYSATSAAALAVFELGRRLADEHGLILVDTKYEFGKDANGNIILLDEVHTPDSSRYWLKNSYDRLFAAHKEPDNIDKEFLRLWYIDHCDPYNDAVLPDAPTDLVVELSRRYILLYEMITGKQFTFPEGDNLPTNAAINKRVNAALTR